MFEYYMRDDYIIFFEQRNSKKRAVLSEEIRKKQKNFQILTNIGKNMAKNDNNCHFGEK
jgi:hypothetical protein